MTKILYLMCDDATAAPVPRLTADRFRVEIAPVRMRSSFDLAALRDILRMARLFSPDIVHAVGKRAATAAALLGRVPGLGISPRPRLIISDAEASPLRRVANRTVEIPVELPPLPNVDAREVRARFGIPATATLIVAGGDYGHPSGLRGAIWAFDVFRYTAPESWLLLVGHGPGRPRLEGFSRGVAFDDYRFRFSDAIAEWPKLAAAADLVWVLASRRGRWLTAVAQARGKPVAGVRSCGIDDGENGRIVSDRDWTELAKLTRRWLDDPATMQKLGANAQRHAEATYAPERVAQRWIELYDGLGR